MSFELFPLEDFNKEQEQVEVKTVIENPYKGMCDYFDNIMKNAVVATDVAEKED